MIFQHFLLINQKSFFHLPQHCSVLFQQLEGNVFSDLFGVTYLLILFVIILNSLLMIKQKDYSPLENLIMK